jgi:hypothetical protein
MKLEGYFSKFVSIWGLKLQFLFKNLDEKPYCVKAFVNKMLEVGARVKHRKWAEQACGVSTMEILQINLIRVVSEMRALLCYVRSTRVPNTL